MKTVGGGVDLLGGKQLYDHNNFPTSCHNRPRSQGIHPFSWARYRQSASCSCGLDFSHWVSDDVRM